MANPEHLAILHQGVAAWNEWRKNNPAIQPDLVQANLVQTNLLKANFFRAELIGADLHGAHLFQAHLGAADFREANLSEANLREANLAEANLRKAYLPKADLSRVDLSGAHLCGAHLLGVQFRKADLREADFNGAHLGGADLTNCIMDGTSFDSVDLASVRGLESVLHRGPSSIGIDTIYRSKGQIPEAFLRGAGVPENFITFMHSLTGKAFEYYSCFISYSDKDTDLAERLYADLQAKGVRCWFAPEDLKIGDKFEFEIDQAIRLYDKLLLVLSERSIESAWVEHEVRGALKKEQEQNRTVLFPIRLDNAVMETTQQWAHDIKRNRHVGDFSQWKDHDYYQKSFARLLRDLLARNAKPSL